MSDIRPFRGYVPKADQAKEIASLPYDVMSSDEAREMAKGKPHSFLHVAKPEIDLPLDIDVYSREVYEKGAENLKKMINEGLLIRSKRECFYIYRQIMGNVIQTGLVAGASVSEYNNDIIKKHEFTRKVKEDDRVNHVNIVNANAEPVFLIYPNRSDLDTISNEITSKTPDIDFVAEDGIAHTLWIIDDEELVNKIQTIFQQIPALYVADGHHRSAAASRVQEMREKTNPDHTGQEAYNYFLAVIFPDNQLYVMDYNRAVKDLNGLTADQLLDKVKEIFNVTELNVSEAKDAKPQSRGEFAMLLDSQWYKLNVKNQYVPENDPVKALDVSILQDNILGPVLGIDDPRTNKRIDFIGGIRGLEELERRCNLDCKVAFALFPTGLDQLMKIADAGEIMPPKSTWFEPKLRSGMVVRMLD